MRIIASMTTIPSRIDLIRPVIEAALDQTISVDHLEINIPYLYARKNAYYRIPEWLERMERVRIFRTKDYGPITKIAPTLLRYKHDLEAFLWSIDDDCAYPRDQLALVCRAHLPSVRRIIARYGGLLNGDGSVTHIYGDLDVTMIEGFGSILYPPACIGDDFGDYLVTTSANEHCRRNDDIVLAMYFTKIGMPMRVYNISADEAPYMLAGWLPQSKVDALHETGHAENYRQIYAFIKSLPGFDTEVVAGVQAGDRGES